MRVSVAVTLLLCASAIAGAQGVHVSVGKANWSASGTTVTAPFILTNLRDRQLRTVQRIDLPRDWKLVTGNNPLSLQASETGLAMVSAMVPGKTLAGTYGIRVAFFDAVTEKFLACDSINIVIEPRKQVDVTSLQHPSFIISGRSYDASFVVRNRGNVRSALQLKARSTLGSAELVERALDLAPGESRNIRIHVKDASTAGMSSDDVVELIVAQADDVTVESRASGRVTVVPPASTTIDDYQRVPTQVALRAANTSGVSPFVIAGAGQLRQGGAERVDFEFKGNAGATSMFGDRDVYRVDLRAPTWRVRAGDNLFSLSQLTTASQEGAGLGAERRFGTFGVGGYAEQFRRTPGEAREAGAYVSAYPTQDLRLAFNVVDRVKGPIPGNVGSLSANFQRPGINVEAEVARSADSAKTGLGHMVHVSGERGVVTFDAGHAQGDSSFLGPQRGAQHDYMFATATPNSFLTVNASASTHASIDPVFGGLSSRERLSLATAGVTLGGLVNVEASGAQHDRRFASLTRETQQLVRTRIMPNLGIFNATLIGEVGRSVFDSGSTRGFSDLSLNAGVSTNAVSLGGFVERYSGGSILKGLDDILTVGGSANMHVLGLDASVVVNSNRMGGVARYWLTNIDAQISHMLRNGSSITMRGRVLQGGYGLATSMPPVAYLEYSMPLGVPVSHLHTPGRATGRVVDAVTGRGIANALVRLGPQVAITDRNGRVSFGGLPAGAHRVTLSQETSYADAVFIGDPVLHVDSVASAPKHFTLKVARGASVDISAREFAVSRTGIAGQADSLVDVGPLVGTGFRLIGDRDTLYRASDENGRLTFTDVAPGKWILVPDGDVPSFHRFDPERLEIQLAPGENRAVIVRLVPKPREVKIMNGGEEVHAIPAEPPGRPHGRNP
ncbi:MAG TPA: carboxypeptidase-like regulatory domain-containing protein [Gemmatimonadaceae bacterium]|nr:carboxypeptidase-like regulatory domain-containing protein [Gemmatimonadaceae bacterium]